MIDMAIIDDDPIDIRLIEAFADASPTDHAIHGFVHLEDALEQITHLTPQILLLDHLMGPHFNYLESAKSLRDAGFNGQIFAMSSDLQLMDIAQNQDGLVSAFFDKCNLRSILETGFARYTA